MTGTPKDSDIPAWYCGGAECGDVVIQGGDTEKSEHMREAHPDMAGMFFWPVEA